MLLSLKGIEHSYPGVRALKSVDFELRSGEIHALVGENGAGKSTLINVMTGALRPGGGTYKLEGREIGGNSPARIRELGVATVYQEFSLAPDLTVMENLFLGRERRRFGVLRKASMRHLAQRVMDEVGFDVDLDAKVAGLERAQRQMVEIVKALLGEPKVIILDEPTASLSDGEAEKLFQALQALRSQGLGIVYVTHRMVELVRLADRATILRDGSLIKTTDMRGLRADDLVELMTGRKAEALFPDIAIGAGEVALEARGVTTVDNKVRDASMAVRFGEVVGVAGLVGCGKSDLARAVYGHVPLAAGDIRVSGSTIAKPDIAAMQRAGVAYFPADRNDEGLALSRPIYENMTMNLLGGGGNGRAGMPGLRREIAEMGQLAKRFRLKAPSVKVAVGTLSGGNRQKVMLARGLTGKARIFLFDEPTVGIDVGARQEVYQFIKELAEAGNAVVVVSSELPEILGLCGRCYVMAHGRVVSEHAGERMTEAAILEHYFSEAAT